HTFPVLCLACALLVRIPLGPRPWLHRLRGGSLRVVRRLHGYYSGVRPPASLRHRLRFLAFSMRTRVEHCLWPDAGSPSFRCIPFARDVFFDPGRGATPRINGIAHVAFDLRNSLRPCGIYISWLNSPPHGIAVYASWPALPSAHATLAPGRLARAYPVRSFTGWTAPALAGAFLASYKAGAASLYGQGWMAGWRFTSSRPAIMRSLSSCFEVTRMWRRRPREFGEEALDEIEPRTMLGREGKLEASRRSSVEPGSCFSRYVRGMIIED